MRKEDKQKVFSLLAENFETDEMKAYFMDMVVEIPDYIFTMPSSTSFKYHNKTQCQTFGQIYHIYMFAKILEYRLNLEWNKELYYNPISRDCMRCVAVFHDAVKCGRHESKHTVSEHPVLAAKWVMDTKVEHDISTDLKKYIANMCIAHSGEWNKDRSGKVIMPKPSMPGEFFIHECDYLASRADLDMTIPNELTEILNSIDFG